MRIVIKEIRKVLNLKLIIILLLFSAAYVTQIPYISMSMDRLVESFKLAL